MGFSFLGPSSPFTFFFLAIFAMVLIAAWVMRYQRHGVGKRIWNALQRTAVEAGADRVVVTVWAFNASARHFYERLEFTPFHDRMALELRDSAGATDSIAI